MATYALSERASEFVMETQKLYLQLRKGQCSVECVLVPPDIMMELRYAGWVKITPAKWETFGTFDSPVLQQALVEPEMFTLWGIPVEVEDYEPGCHNNYSSLSPPLININSPNQNMPSVDIDPAQGESVGWAVEMELKKDGKLYHKGPSGNWWKYESGDGWKSE